MSVTSLAVVLAAVEQALAGLEAESGWQPNDLLAGVLVRRRHSLRLLRRALTQADVADPRASLVTTGQRAAVPGDLGGLIQVEERLAALLDGWLADMRPTHPHRALAQHLRAETDDAARMLRMMMASRG